MGARTTYDQSTEGAPKLFAAFPVDIGVLSTVYLRKANRMPPTKLTSTKRFAVRMSLVTGSTLATIIGAQSLSSLDKHSLAVTDPAVPVFNQQSPDIPRALPTVALDPAPVATLVPTSIDGDPAAVHAAPQITILRHPGQANSVGEVTPQSAPTQPNTMANAAIKPPAPVEIAPPAPIIVQAPAAQVAGPAPAAPAAAPAPRPATRSS
jgi:hypothetical protein